MDAGLACTVEDRNEGWQSRVASIVLKRRMASVRISPARHRPVVKCLEIVSKLW